MDALKKTRIAKAPTLIKGRRQGMANSATPSNYPSMAVNTSVGVVGPMGIPNAGRGGLPSSNFMPENDAGADAVKLVGTWQLDRDTSDSINDFLEAMGLPLIARQAADKLDLTVVINQTNSEFQISRKTRLFADTKCLTFGHDISVKSNTIHVTGTPECITTVSQLHACNGVLKDTRMIDSSGGEYPLAVNNKRMKVILELCLPDKLPVITTRYFNFISESTITEITDEMLMKFELHGSVHGPAALETKRKR